MTFPTGSAGGGAHGSPATADVVTIQPGRIGCERVGKGVSLRLTCGRVYHMSEDQARTLFDDLASILLDGPMMVGPLP